MAQSVCKVQRRTRQSQSLPPLFNNAQRTSREMDRILTEHPKVLEFILLTLDQRSLLVSAMRVCKQWRSIIAESTPLQEHLFLKPTQSPGTVDSKTRQLNPLLQLAFPLFFELPPIRPSVWASFAHQPTSLPHTLLARPNAVAITRRGASWRRMLLQQPPASALGVITAETAYFTDILSFPGGVQMGTLYDLVYKYSCRDENPASWCMAWRPALQEKDDMWAVDDTVASWMEENNLDLTLFVVKYDAWGAKTMGLEDRRLEGDPVAWEDMKCEEFRDVEVNERFYFVSR
ncbi:hypothetical protein B0T16DRAFT_421187 [Cercophora newfieldiana]|uniref:F-box domain-containing protein n=1 Tax=Cercophora newfieldiana TaxID=92897 RepID=A0AA39XY29_9PEZI|nr:hypothetical protein B0T16DRAFT_421187 [Cercophora newfieldiana]